MKKSNWVFLLLVVLMASPAWAQEAQESQAAAEPAVEAQPAVEVVAPPAAEPAVQPQPAEQIVAEQPKAEAQPQPVEQVIAEQPTAEQPKIEVQPVAEPVVQSQPQPQPSPVAKSDVPFREKLRNRFIGSGENVRASAGGAAGATEEGFAIGVRGDAQAADGSIARIEGNIGSPILRIKGSTEAIPLRLIAKKTPLDKYGSSFDYELTFAPATTDAQLTLSKNRGNLSHIIIAPKLAAQMKLTLQGLVTKSSGIVRLHAAPATGLAHDGDGTAFAFGSRIGVEGVLSAEFFEAARFELGGGVDHFVSFLDNMNDSTSVHANGRYTLKLSSGQKVFAGLDVSVSQMDVKPSNPIMVNEDDHHAVFVGISSGVAF